MNITFLRSLLLGACCAVPLVAVAGDIDIIESPTPFRVDIPDMREGWGFLVEGAAIRGYTNDLGYVYDLLVNSVTEGIYTTNTLDAIFENVDPQYAFDLRVGVDYTLADYANVLNLSYEHLFNNPTNDSFNDNSLAIATGALTQKLDAITLSSEQHILIGSYWETTFTGGARFAHLSQDLSATLITYGGTFNTTETQTSLLTAQFNGVGPLLGLGTLFHLNNSFGIGAELQGALLIGKNKISQQTGTFTASSFHIGENASFINAEDVYSIAPELFAKLYGNYFYRFINGMEVLVEAGWRVDQFLSVRVLDNALFANNPSSTVILPGLDINKNNDIGFSGPYLMAHIKL